MLLDHIGWKMCHKLRCKSCNTAYRKHCMAHTVVKLATLRYLNDWSGKNANLNFICNPNTKPFHCFSRFLVRMIKISPVIEISTRRLATANRSHVSSHTSKNFVQSRRCGWPCKLSSDLMWSCEIWLLFVISLGQMYEVQKVLWAWLFWCGSYLTCPVTVILCHSWLL